MGLIDKLLGRKAITTWDKVDDFVDRNASFLINRTFYEYARARSGVLSTQLLREKQFQEAVENGRWRAFPICVGNVAEMIAAYLRRQAPDRDGEIVAALGMSARIVLGRYPLPEGFEADFWDQARAATAARMGLVAAAPPKPAQDIAIASFPGMFDLVPLHPEVRKHDYEVVLNNTRSTMLSIIRDFERDADPAALLASLPRAG